MIQIMKIVITTCTLLLSVFLSANSVAQPATDSGWVWINYLGASESFNSMLYINLEGEDDIKTSNADWDAKSFTNSAYYAMKLEKWNNNNCFIYCRLQRSAKLYWLWSIKSCIK